MGASIRAGHCRRSTRRRTRTPGRLPDEWIDSVMAHFDQGTQSAILRLYRSSAEPGALREAGEHLE